MCAPFFEPYCAQIEKLLHAVALKTSLHDIESCIILCDLVEEFISSLILSSSHTKHRVLIQKDNVIDWEFWFKVVKMMLSGENSNTALRALSFLFNVWDHIPISVSSSATDGKYSGENDNTETIFDLYFDEHEGLRWNCTVWLLSPSIWKKYFCHWSPLVRGYYLRLLCWRVASVGSDSGLLSSVLFNNYNSDVRFLLEQRLQYTFHRFQEFTRIAEFEGRTTISVAPCNPVFNRYFKIISNPAAQTTNTSNSQQEGKSRRIDPYEVFDDIAYSCPPVTLPSDLLSSSAANPPSQLTRKNRSASTSSVQSLGVNIKKRWSTMRGSSSGNLQKYLSDTEDETQPANEAKQRPMSEFLLTAPSLSFSESTESSSTESPNSLTPGSPPKSDVPLSPESLTMSLIPPPPQILRKRPQVVRPLFKFSLEYSEEAIRKHRNLLCGQKATDKHNVSSPRLPFGVPSGFGGKLPNSSNTGSAYNSHVRLVLDLYQNNSANDVSSRYSTASEGSKDDHDLVNSEFEYLHLHGGKRLAAKALDDTNFWKYAGRALNEWEQLVVEFEDFVQTRMKTNNLVRLEDVGVPFMIAEIPAKALLG